MRDVQIESVVFEMDVMELVMMEVLLKEEVVEVVDGFDWLVLEWVQCFVLTSFKILDGVLLAVVDGSALKPERETSTS